MFCQHLRGDKYAVCIHFAFCYDAFIFMKKIWQNACVTYRNIFFEIGDNEVYLQAVRVTLNAGFLHHAAQAQVDFSVKAARCKITWRDKHVQVLSQREKNKACGKG